MKHAIITLSATTLTLVLFQNCAPAEFEKIPEQTQSLGVPATPTELEEALAACDRLTDPRMKTVEVPVFFDNPLNEVGSTPVCKWNQDGNVAVNNGYMTARYEQLRTIPLPASATLCNLDFEFVTQAMEYDDEFFFLVNDKIVGASNDYWQTNHLTSQSLAIGGGSTLDLYSFDWNPIAGMGNHNKTNLPPGSSFCLGAKEGLSTCSWPRTEVAGNISMTVAPKVMTALGLLNKGQGIRIAFVTTGDDDVTKDCQHEPLSMKLKVRYLEQ